MKAPCRPTHAQQPRQRGLALIEFTLAAPPLLLLLFGSVEFGHFLIQYSTLNDGVRNAARFVAGQALSGQSGVLLQGSQWSTLATQGRNLAVYGNAAGTGTALLPSLSPAQITVAQNTATNNISVTAAYPYQSLFGATMPDFFGGRISTTYTLTISTIMRAL